MIDTLAARAALPALVRAARAGDEVARIALSDALAELGDPRAEMVRTPYGVESAAVFPACPRCGITSSMWVGRSPESQVACRAYVQGGRYERCWEGQWSDLLPPLADLAR